MVRNLKFDYNECLRLGLLKKIPPSIDKAMNSLKAADKWLAETEINIKAKSFNSALISSYLAMFHASRAILFLDGLREKSHSCIARYIEGIYVKRGLLEEKWIIFLDHCRETRHNNQYGFGFNFTVKESKETFGNAKEFINQMKKLVDKITKET